MSDILKHVVVADSIGTTLYDSSGRWGGPGTAFCLGIASHAVMDMLEPDFTVNWFNPGDLQSATPFLGVQAGGLAFMLQKLLCRKSEPRMRLYVRLAAIIGAVLPDVIDGIYALLNPCAWYSGRMLFPWHSRTRQTSPMPMWATSLLTLCVLLLRFALEPIIFLLRPLASLVADARVVLQRASPLGPAHTLHKIHGDPGHPFALLGLQGRTRSDRGPLISAAQYEYSRPAPDPPATPSQLPLTGMLVPENRGGG